MRLLLIARDNIKKRKGNSLILLLLVALAVLLLYTGISVLVNMGNVIDNRNEAINGADYFLFTQSADSGKVEAILKEQEEMEYLESEKTLYASGVKFYNEAETQEDADQLEFFFMNRDTKRTLSTIQLIDKGEAWKENSIILPYYMKVGLGYRTGDILKLEYKGDTYSFEIYGFTEDVMFSTPTNISAEKCFISSEAFARYEKEWKSEGVTYHAKLKAGSDAEKFDSDMNQLLNKKVADFKYLTNWSLDYVTMKYGTSVSANIFMGILTVFAFLLILIAMVIVSFNINNSIEMNMKNIGMLEAVGYTSFQLIAAAVLEFLFIGILGVVVGLLGALGTSNIVGGIMSSSIGVSWQMGFDAVSAGLSIAATLFMMMFAVLLCSGKYRKIAPLDALRNGIHTHNFKKNPLRLDNTILPLNIAIGIKKVFQNKKKNVILCLIIVLLTFCTNEAVAIYQTFASEENRLLEITGFETPDISVSMNAEEAGEGADSIAELKRKVETIPVVEQVLEYTSCDVSCNFNEKEMNVNCDVYDQTDSLRVENVIEGRRPEYANEVMISSVVQERLGVSCGDVIYLEMGDVSKDYLIVGISQGITQLGRKAMVTLEGIQRLNAEIEPVSLYVYAQDKTNLKDLMADMKEEIADETVTITNYQDYISAATESIVTVMKVLCEVMLVTVIVVIAMVLVLLIKVQLVRDRQQMGIYRALGYTSRQLLLQTIAGYLPVILTGAVIGCILSWFGAESSFVLCLQAFGIKKCGIALSVPYMFVIVTAIVLWAAFISAACAFQIRKIIPWKMLQV